MIDTKCPSCEGFGSLQFCGGMTCPDCDGIGRITVTKLKELNRTRAEAEAIRNKAIQALFEDQKAKILKAFEGDIRPKGPPINALRHFLYDEIVDLENRGKYKKAQFLRSIIDKYDAQNRK